jgi:hypothetical protein
MQDSPRLPADFKTLEIAVQNAGSALACSFSSSAEFEAAIIAAKRAAGIYGPKRRRRQVLNVVMTGTAAVLAALFISLLF